MADIAIIGAGHNGLVTACYLAKAKHKVAVFEKRPQVGGCVITDETTFPGFKTSTLSYVNSLFYPQIVEDLGLRKYGYEVLPRDPFSFTPTPKGSSDFLLLGREGAFNKAQIEKFSKKDAENYPKYEEALTRVADFVSSTRTDTPHNNFLELHRLIKFIPRLTGLGYDGVRNLVKLFSGDAVEFLNEWFESDILKATLLTDAAIGAVDFSGYVLLHHVMGEAGGVKGAWGYQKGGMGGLTNSLVSAAKALGVEIHTNASVKGLQVKNGRACGLILENNKCYRADYLVSNADPYVTFVKLAPKACLPAGFLSRVEKIDFASATMKVNMILKGWPDFDCKPSTSNNPEEQHMGTIHLAPTVQYVTEAAKNSRMGHPSYNPILELTIPSAVDNSLVSSEYSGYHVMGIFVQFTPYKMLPEYGSWNDHKHQYFCFNILPTLRRFIRNIDYIMHDYQIISPLDLEQEFGLTGGNIFHGAMTLDQLFHKRPIGGYADYRTPIKGLYMCGAGTHPGGGVMGICGYNAAREILKDLKS